MIGKILGALLWIITFFIIVVKICIHFNVMEAFWLMLFGFLLILAGELTDQSRK